MEVRRIGIREAKQRIKNDPELSKMLVRSGWREIALDLGGDRLDTILLAGVAAIGAAARGDVGSYMVRGTDLRQSMCDYARVVLPVLTGAAAASGSVSGASAHTSISATILSSSLIFIKKPRVYV